MARTKKQRRREAKLIEAAALLGAVIGLLNTPRATAGTPCHGDQAKCMSHSITAAVQPYLKHALVGGVVALVAVMAALLLWHWRSRPSAKPGHSRAISERVRHEVWRRDQGSCVDCGSRARLEFDHIIPFSKGGSNTARNVELRCEPCNRRKGARI